MIIDLATQPSRRIDTEVHRKFVGYVLELNRGPVANGVPVPHYSTSFDAVMDILATALPGWSLRLERMADFDIVAVGPDFTDPVHGEAFNTRWPDFDPDAFETTDSHIVMASIAKTPRAALALLALVIEVATAEVEGRKADADLPAALAFFASIDGPVAQTGGQAAPGQS
jgi:hypothetical protein